jgi:Na+/H+ antiporter NhaA
MASGNSSLFSPGSWTEGSRIAHVLRKETVGGALLLGAAVIALVWANSPWSSSYFSMLDLVAGPELLHLNLSLETWAADGLLAIFFFVAGLELKREFVAGDLRDRRRAAVPVFAAVGGMIVPAAIYLAFAAGTGPKGWAIPTATDIAFALAVLAVISTHLPLADPIALGIIAGLVIGKPLGIVTATFLTAKITRSPLQQGLTWPDVTGVAILGGIGFTVSLLIGELAFDPAADDHVKIAVLTGSLAAALLTAVVLRLRNRRYRRLWEEENRDDDHDGIPDIYQRE